MSSQAAPRIGYRQALASRQFRALFASQLVSVSGTSIAAVALTILVYRRTASPLLASLTFALGFLPYLLGGGLLSSVIDRVRPRRLVASCDLVSALLAATMAWPGIPVMILLTLLLAIGTLASVSSGARVALARSAVAEGAYVLDARVRDAVPTQLFARTMTLNSAGLMTLQGVGFTLAGAIAQGIGPAIAIAVAGGLGLTATTGLLRSDLRPRRGRIDRPDTAPLAAACQRAD
jgi:hypothetical protein